MRARPTTTLSASFLVAALVAAQTSVDPDEIRVAYKPYTPPGAASFRTETRLVEVPTVVRDFKGNPIANLTAADFRVTDESHESPIASFSAQTAASPEPHRRRLIVIVFDDVALRIHCGTLIETVDPISFAGTSAMKESVERFLKTSFRPEDLISFVAFASGKSSDLTNDASKLIAAIHKTPITSACPFSFDKYGMLEEVVDSLAQIPGDRSIVLCSYVFPGNAASRDRLTRKAIRAQIPIHTIDMHGVIGLRPTPLTVLSEATGGHSFRNNNDFDRGVALLAAPPAVRYLIGINPEGARDGSYHSLGVNLLHHKGLDIEARPGYFAPDAKDDLPPKERPIDHVLSTDDAPHALPVAFSALPDSLVAGGLAVSVVAHVDIQSLDFVMRKQRHVQRLQILAALYDRDNNLIAAKEGELEFALKDASLTELSKNGVNATLTLPAPAGAYRVRTVVADSAGRITAATGAIRIGSATK